MIRLLLERQPKCPVLSRPLTLGTPYNQEDLITGGEGDPRRVKTWLLVKVSKQRIVAFGTLPLMVVPRRPNGSHPRLR